MLGVGDVCYGYWEFEVGCGELKRGCGIGDIRG